MQELQSQIFKLKSKEQAAVALPDFPAQKEPTIKIFNIEEEKRMNKFLNKWFRQIHRWIAIPTALLIPVALTIKLIGNPALVTFWEKWDKLPSVFMLFMAITGAYLYLLPYIVKYQRKQKSNAL